MGRGLVAFCGELRTRYAVERLCLGGGLFFNTFFNTLVQNAGLFERVFVPINPGNAGLAVGGALLVGAERGESPGPVSPFLGPEYGPAQIKAVLDGCKLSYSFLSESDAIDAAVRALTRGQLVGWFTGRMEWGPRALGHRSILADCRSPFALDNLNLYLRKRERWWPFGISTCAESAATIVDGPPESPCMEFEYVPRDDRFSHVLPEGARVLRVQTVSKDQGAFWQLHRRIEQATGTPALVNTSFNAFREPIVCDPRDAVRVFYGTGLDVLFMDRFIITK
jgi:carbamoyltransferase